jgi:hypothetical protein
VPNHSTIGADSFGINAKALLLIWLLSKFGCLRINKKATAKNHYLSEWGYLINGVIYSIV